MGYAAVFGSSVDHWRPHPRDVRGIRMSTGISSFFSLLLLQSVLDRWSSSRLAFVSAVSFDLLKTFKVPYCAFRAVSLKFPIFPSYMTVCLAVCAHFPLILCSLGSIHDKLLTCFVEKNSELWKPNIVFRWLHSCAAHLFSLCQEDTKGKLIWYQLRTRFFK